ncbi:hypothetical protein VNO78_03613 [Psophocarpus tetragonolobus]|uniref:Uncharacterized protein n=1 Tax=Psophocarpus tetragonolobus TaxID=3891 RepID=A0AAN9T3E7_PSOTE
MKFIQAYRTCICRLSAHACGTADEEIVPFHGMKEDLVNAKNLSSNASIMVLDLMKQNDKNAIVSLDDEYYSLLHLRNSVHRTSCFILVSLSFLQNAQVLLIQANVASQLTNLAVYREEPDRLMWTELYRKTTAEAYQSDLAKSD